MFKSGQNRVAESSTSTNYNDTPHKRYQKYPHRLNLYDRPPMYDVTLEEFETTALDRLRILAEIESSAVRNRTWEETKNVTNTQSNKYLPLHSNSSIPSRNPMQRIEELDEERRSDLLSHFVLRLAFCRSEDLRDRFVRAEGTLFRVRFETDDTGEREAFLNSKDFNWIAVDKEEKSKFSEELKRFYPVKTAQAQFDADKFFKVRWTRVLDLVEKRRVFLKKGWAYVPARDLASIVYSEFETRLHNDLELTARALPKLEEDNRLIPVLENLSKGFLAGVPSEWNSITEGDGEQITARMVDGIAGKHYPMCMKSLHSNLRRDSHLKHFGRLHYGLFLKVLGLSVEEAIVFWKEAFKAKIQEDKFNKEYKYNIRHSYGLEGKRTSYAAKSCQHLITGDPSHPGCPYKQLAKSPDNLKTSLMNSYGAMGLKSQDLPEIINMVKFEHYNVACTRVYEITHGITKGNGVGDGETINHPNQYAKLSIELEKERGGISVEPKKEVAKSEEVEMKVDEPPAATEEENMTVD